MGKGENFTVREHYVPQFYLNYFAGKNGKVSCISVKDKTYYSAAPKEICFKKNIYETMDENGNFCARNCLERYFSEIEGCCATLFTEIIQRCRELQNQHALILNQSEKDIIARYIAVQYLRNPTAQAEHHAMMEEILKRPLNKIEKAVSYTQHAFLSDGSGFSPLYERMSCSIPDNEAFSFLMPEEKSVHFLTSDFPVWADTTKKATDIRSYYFVLTPDIAIYVEDRKKMLPSQRNHIVGVDNSNVARFNAFVVQHAPNIVFGQNLSSTERKFILDNLP